VSEARVGVAQLRAVQSAADAARLFAGLGYDATPHPVNPTDLQLPGVTAARYVRGDQSKRKSYGLLLAETTQTPRALRPLARALQLNVHDNPLGVLGVSENGGPWRRMIVFRPRVVSGKVRAVTVTRLDIDLDHPSNHDAEVISELRWRSDLPNDQARQEAVTAALDVEQVTNQFFKGLRPRFDAVQEAVTACAARNIERDRAIQFAGGARQVSIRILTQILFCYFLQRKKLLAGHRDYLTRAYVEKSDLYYPSVLEPLFYDVLAKPKEMRPASAKNLDIPFLNGGLFERRYGDASLDLPDAVFGIDEGLLGYLDHWSFTAAEETADEAEVAVDPEMLGRVFESLLPEAEREKKGTYYTPRPVVQFMCREALVARLSSDDLPEPTLRTLVSAEDPIGELGKDQSWARTLDDRLETLTVIDPAVGSGAFLLGMMAEIVRLRGLCHQVRNRTHPTPETIHAWKLHAIERCLFGVDIEPTAVDLCRLRLWLSLVVEVDPARGVDPLPNLEYRTIQADSLTDFIAGAAIQDTRKKHVQQLELGSQPAAAEVIDLRARYFSAAVPAEKAALKAKLVDVENELLGAWLDEKRAELRSRPEATVVIDDLKDRLRAPDRVYPVFMPGFSAPDVWNEGGWDVVIMNPPYVGRKEIPRRYDEAIVEAYRLHYGKTADMMILFAERAIQLARHEGVISMIFNDSIFTSIDANDLRRHLTEDSTVTVIARTKCFEGQAVNGGVIVAKLSKLQGVPVRWVEGYKRETRDFAGATANFDDVKTGEYAEAGEMEVFVAPREAYTTLPHRPLYRPSKPALLLQERFTQSEDWKTLGSWGENGWPILSETKALDKSIEQRRKLHFYERLEPGDWVLLGLVTEGGQGLATADDKRFLAAIEGSSDSKNHLEMQERIEKITLKGPHAARYQSLQRTHGDRQGALLALWESSAAELSKEWPRVGSFQVVSPDQVRTSPPSAEEKKEGISGKRCWVPFEKGDQGQEIDRKGKTAKIGSAWTRTNPLVIDWSKDAVALLKRRAAAKGSQSPRMQNEDLWFSAGITWNRVASYLRVRIVPEVSIFADKAPLLRPLPWVKWLSVKSLLALMNSDTLDFVMRTFLGSRMMVEVGDVRRLVIPVLSVDQQQVLEGLTGRATAAKQAKDNAGKSEPLAGVEQELNDYVRDLYRIPRTAKLWVVR
jgi:hypothetical protein